MSRLLAIDYGKKRVGLAWTDPLQITITPLETIAPDKLLAWIQDRLVSENIEKVIIGLAHNHQNQDTNSTPLIRHFIQAFRNRFPDTPIVTVDESYTSQEARQYMMTHGYGKKEREKKDNVDKIAAAFILQRYMDAHC